MPIHQKHQKLIERLRLPENYELYKKWSSPELCNDEDSDFVRKKMNEINTLILKIDNEKIENRKKLYINTCNQYINEVENRLDKNGWK